MALVTTGCWEPILNDLAEGLAPPAGPPGGPEQPAPGGDPVGGPEAGDESPGDSSPEEELEDGTTVAAGCPADVFMDLSDVDGAGAGYSAPAVSVTCTETTMTVQANGIPHYEFTPVTPNPLSAQSHSWTVPLNPQLADEISEIPLLGAVAFTVNGIPVYGPNEGGFPDPYGDPVYNAIVDYCLGHTGPTGDYHYHALDELCFFVTEATEPSPILGYALDGFPIYGPRGCVDSDCTDVVTFESSWEQTGDPSTYAWDNHACDSGSCDQAVGNKLDRCNGRIGPDGTYRYHATTGFPYVVGCYRGTPSTDAGAGDPTSGQGSGTGTGQQDQGAAQPPQGGSGDAGQVPGPGSDSGDSGAGDSGAGGAGPGGQGPNAGGPGAGSGPAGQDQTGQDQTGQGGQQQGPATCETDSDCLQACAGAACACDMTLGGTLGCIPTCTTDSDCPAGPNGAAMSCDNAGLCVP